MLTLMASFHRERSAEGWYGVPCRIRDTIDKMLQKDCVLSSLVAMEAALNDERYEVGCPIHAHHSTL